MYSHTLPALAVQRAFCPPAHTCATYTYTHVYIIVVLLPLFAPLPGLTLSFVLRLFTRYQLTDAGEHRYINGNDEAVANTKSAKCKEMHQELVDCERQTPTVPRFTGHAVRTKLRYPARLMVFIPCISVTADGC